MMTIAKDFAAKAFVAFVAAAMMISLFAPAAKAQTAEQLQTMINDLLAQIATLQAQVGQGGQSVSSGVCPFTWTRDLNMGATGADVMKLQQFLNANADTRVSASGAGSVGAETEYYGPATAAAVAKMQVMYRAEILTPLGMVNPSTFFGPSTRAKANALCVAAPVEPVAPVEPTEPTEPVEPGVTLGDGEGSIDTVNQTSADETTLREGESSGLLAFEAEVTGDVSVNRVDVYMDGNGTGSTRAENYFQGASLIVDGEEVATLDVSDWTEDTYGKVAVHGNGNEYRLRFTGLDLIFADGDVPQFQVVLDANNVIDSTDQTATWAITLETDSIRTVDGQGFTDTAGGSYEPTFGIDALLVAELAVTESDASPDDTTFEVSDTATTKDVTVAMFDVREKNSVAVTVEDMTFTVTATNTITNESLVAKTASIWDGSTKLASKSVTDGGVVLFENMGLEIAADETVALTVKLDFADSDAYIEGETVTVAYTSVDDVVDENGNTEDDITTTVGPVTSGTHTLRTTGIAVTAGTFTAPAMVSDGVTTANNYGNYVMNVEVAAFGDNYYVPLTTNRGATTTVGVAYQIEDSNGTIVSTGTSTGAAFGYVSGGTKTGQYVKITDGGTAIFKLTVPFDPASTGTYRVQILSIGYDLAATTPSVAETAEPASDFEADNLYVTS